MTYERLSSTDASFLHIETPHEPQHVGSLSYVEGGPLRDASGRIEIEDLRARIEQRLHLIPRLRQRLQFVPFSIGRPIWVDDDRFDIDYHVRLTSVPRPGDATQVHDLMGRIQSIPLDRSRPLWEIWLVDGIEDDRIGLIIKCHHALGDGMANVDLALALVDLEPDPPPDEPAPAWDPAPGPSTGRLVGDSVIDMVTRPAALARTATRAIRRPEEVASTIADTARALIAFTGSAAPAPWNVPVGMHRRWCSASVPMELVRATRASNDATVNDVVLAASAGALREFMLHHDDDGAERTLKAMVPVSRRSADEHGASLGNKVTLIVVDLPTDEPDPIQRLRRVHAEASEQKGSGLAEGAEHIVSAAGELTMLAGPLARLLSRSIPMNLVITNIPGPPTALYVRGARVLAAHPYVEVIDNEGLTIAVLSYDDQLHFGITADLEVIPDLGVLAEGIAAQFTLLAEAST